MDNKLLPPTRETYPGAGVLVPGAVVSQGISLAVQLFVADRVACAAHRTDDVGQTAGVYRLAQAADMHVDRALVDVDGFTPDIVEELAAREHPSRMAHHEL